MLRRGGAPSPLPIPNAVLAPSAPANPLLGLLLLLRRWVVGFLVWPVVVGHCVVAGQKRGPDDWEDIGTKNAANTGASELALPVKFCRRLDPGAIPCPPQAEWSQSYIRVNVTCPV